jgi:hypothetical protein
VLTRPRPEGKRRTLHPRRRFDYIFTITCRATV